MRALVAAAWILCCSTSAAFSAQKNWVEERVIALHPGGMLQLEATGKAALSNVLLPDARQSDDWLAEHVLQQTIRFKPSDEDRYGRLRIESDVARDMLRDGVAIYYMSDGQLPDGWRAAEYAARTRGSGVWSVAGRELSPQDAAQHIGNFALVEGTVIRVYEGKRFTAINFGEDWREDFSITIPAKVRRSMKATLSQLKPGATIEVRGMLHAENGPMMTLTHPDNLEIR